MSKNTESACSLTAIQRHKLILSQRILKRKLRAAERALTKMRERYLSTFLPVLAISLDQYYVEYKDANFGGSVGRFDATADCSGRTILHAPIKI